MPMTVKSGANSVGPTLRNGLVSHEALVHVWKHDTCRDCCRICSPPKSVEMAEAARLRIRQRLTAYREKAELPDVLERDLKKINELAS